METKTEYAVEAKYEGTDDYTAIASLHSIEKAKQRLNDYERIYADHPIESFRIVKVTTQREVEQPTK